MTRSRLPVPVPVSLADALPVSPDDQPTICRTMSPYPARPHAIACRSFAETLPVSHVMVMSIAKRSARMGAESDYGRKQPNGRKIVELRKGKGLKQEAL